MVRDWRLFQGLPRPLRLLVFSQLVFNAGFYLVVPFLASYLEDDLRLSGALVGIILGLRAFSQQGLFFLGGALADWFGVKPLALTGIGIRVAGFLLLALGSELTAVVVGVVLIGLAAALFSPASESAIAGLAGELAASGGPSRTQILGLQQVASQTGAALGPLLGGLVVFVPFQATCAIAAGLFAGVGLMQLCWLPAGLRVGRRARLAASLGAALGNRRFLAFAGLNCLQLVAYNQMYLALPVEITRTGAGSGTITWYFLIASVLVIGGQSVITRLTGDWPLRRVFRSGYLAMALAFAVVAAAVWRPSPGGLIGALPAVGFVILLHLGTMVINPRARDTVAVLANETNLGAHLGFMASVGGLAVLLAGGPLGALLEAARTPGVAALPPWLLLMALLSMVVVLAGPLLGWILPEPE